MLFEGVEIKNCQFKQAIDLIRQEGSELLRDVSLFDIYVGAQISKGKKSIAFSLTYRSDKWTLADEEVNEVHQHIFNRLNSELGAELRQAFHSEEEDAF